MHSSPFTCRAAITLLPLALVASTPASSLAEPKYAGWTKVEASRDVREMKEKLRDGGQLEAAARSFLEETALPQLALEENRPLIERTRKRIRELLLTDIADDKTYGEILTLVAGFMTALARDEQADPVVRVNAMLLIGELRSKDGKPWAAAAPALAAAAGDSSLPDAVRVAALVGAARHVEKGGGSESVVTTFGPPLAAILGEPPAAERAVEQDWLLSRTLQMLPQLVKPASPKLATTLAGFVADDSRSIDLRVRAAAALGAMADSTSGVDAAGLVDAIRKLAVASLEAEEKAVESRRFESQFRQNAGAAAGRQPFAGFEGPAVTASESTTIPELACRRAAWRIHTLGTAILSADEKQGLATLMGDAAGPAKDLAKQLVAGGVGIDENPDEDTLLGILDELRPRAAGDQRPARQPAADAPPAEEKPTAPPPGSPFDSPFK